MEFPNKDLNFFLSPLAKEETIISKALPAPCKNKF